MILRSCIMVSSGDPTTVLLDGLSPLYCSAHGEHMSWTPFTEEATSCLTLGDRLIEADEVLDRWLRTWDGADARHRHAIT